MDPLILGLPDEIARECLSRVPYTGFSTVKSVCKLWREELDSPAFHRLRKSAGLCRTVVAVAQSDPLTNSASKTAFLSNEKQQPSTAVSLTYRLAIYEPETGSWSKLPAIPGLANGLPLFCQVVAAQRALVVVSGWDPVSWVASDKVFVYDFTAASWRPRTRMPGPRRSFFACASDNDTTVFVAGGHDEDKNALRSAMAYDVANDRWTALPDMAVERDECKGVYCNGKFQVLGGYSTDFQGQFGKSSESFDIATWTWGPVEEETLAVGTCPRTCVAGSVGGGGGRLYRFRVGKVEVKEEEGSTWVAVAEVPEGVKVAPWMVAVNGKEGEELLVVGSACHGGVHEGYVLEVEKGRWRKAVVPEEYSGHVQVGCCLEI